MKLRFFTVVMVFVFAFSALQEASAQKRPKKNEVVVVKPSAVELVYNDMPLELLYPVDAYIKKRKIEAPKVKTEDNLALRKDFIRKVDTTRQYLQVQLPGDFNFIRMQLFNTGKRHKLVGMETNEYKDGINESRINFYRKDSGVYVDLTQQFIPELDYKYISKTLKGIYKKEFKEDDIWVSKGYNSEDALKRLVYFTISPDENKILVMEPHLSTILYEMTWNEKKQHFDLKKTK